MLEPIKSEEGVLKLARRFGWDNFTISQLLRIRMSAEQYGLALFREVTVSTPEFALRSALASQDHTPTTYFKAEQFGLLNALFDVLNDDKKLRGKAVGNLEDRVTALEEALAKTGLVTSASATTPNADIPLEPTTNKDDVGKVRDEDDLFAYNLSSPEFDVCLHRMVASTGGTVEFGIKTDSFSRYFARYHRRPALKNETMVAKALPKRVARTYAFYFELPRDLGLLQQVLKSDAKLHLESLRNNKFYSH